MRTMFSFLLIENGMANPTQVVNLLLSGKYGQDMLSQLQ